MLFYQGKKQNTGVNGDKYVDPCILSQCIISIHLYCIQKHLLVHVTIKGTANSHPFCQIKFKAAINNSHIGLWQCANRNVNGSF